MMHNLFHKFLCRISQRSLQEICLHFAFHELLVFSSVGREPSVHTPKWICTPKGNTGIAALLPFLLHGSGQDVIENIIATAKKMAPYIIILDYRQPERNLDFPCFWLTGGVERANRDAGHKVAWCHFMVRGGLEAFVHRPLCRVPLCGGAASLVVMPAFSRSSA